MSGILGKAGIKAIYRALTFSVLIGLGLTAIASPAAAARERTLYLYYTHTKETAKITFKRNGRYDSRGLAKLNRFLRDWRRNEPTKMDPRLFDLVWEVYQEVGAKKPIHVVSAYRSPKTNEMLRSRSRAVAKNSNHTRGMAMDFFIPGVSISKLRAAAMKKQWGGVGYYPTSGSPFVHLDTGSVRAWPRMNSAQLKRLFPNGKTLHIPSNGVVLSKKGYAQAQAEYKRCKKIPCKGGTQFASLSNNSDEEKSSGRTLMDVLFGGNEKNVEAAKPPTQRKTATTSFKVVALKGLPPARPNTLDVPTILVAEADTSQAVTPPIKPPAIEAATAAQPKEENLEIPSRFAVAAIDGDTAPTPPSRFTDEVLATASLPKPHPAHIGVPTPQVSAYAPATPPPAPDAQKALAAILAANQKQKPVLDSKLETASLTGNFDDFASILRNAKSGNTKSRAPRPKVNLAQAEGELLLPDFEHILDLMARPERFEQKQYAVLYEPDTAKLVTSAVLGNKSQYGFSTEIVEINVSEITFSTTNSL